MTCDHIKGCVCKENGDCGGGQRLLDLTRAAPLDANSDGSISHSSTVAIVLSVLFLTIVTVILVVIYYKRRMKRLQKDLANRSVYYVENSVIDPARHQNHDMIVTDRDPIDNQQDPILHTVFQQNNVPNNLTASQTVKLEKNVNIDRFKLGLENDEGAACSSSAVGVAGNSNLNSNLTVGMAGNSNFPNDSCASVSGACALPDSSDDEELPDLPPVKKFIDVNVFEEESPSKEKNNFLLDNSRKINKANVDLVFHKNNLVIPKKTEEEKAEEEIPEDEIAIAKMTAYLHQNHKH